MEPLKLLTVGTSFGSTWMLAAARNENWELAGVVARTRKSREKAGRDFGIPGSRQFANLDEALARCDDVDAVAIAVPNALHHELARKVLEHGKHLILEKPITETWEQAIDLVTLANENGLRTCVGQTLRGEVMIRLMEHFLREGAIGRIEQLTFECHWLWVGDPTVERNWRFRLPHMFLDDIGIHQIDEIRMLLGNTRASEVYARTIQPPSYPIEGLQATASSTWLMEDGVLVNYFGSMGARGKSEGWFGRVNVFGEKGSMFRESSGQPYLYLDGKKGAIGLDDEYGDDIEEILPNVEYERIDFLLQDFTDAIREGRPAITDLNDNINSHAILLAMKKSAAEGRVVKVQEEFPLP